MCDLSVQGLMLRRKGAMRAVDAAWRKKEEEKEEKEEEEGLLSQAHV